MRRTLAFFIGKVVVTRLTIRHFSPSCLSSLAGSQPSDVDLANQRVAVLKTPIDKKLTGNDGRQKVCHASAICRACSAAEGWDGHMLVLESMDQQTFPVAKMLTSQRWVSRAEGKAWLRGCNLAKQCPAFALWEESRQTDEGFVH